MRLLPAFILFYFSFCYFSGVFVLISCAVGLPADFLSTKITEIISTATVFNI